ncbi:hypothetical protein B0E47_07735 [Rhodanobacter sp. B05]|nr:hypothetical protein B0E47_07735 [Rhodanobacter sp. B05]
MRVARPAHHHDDTADTPLPVQQLTTASILKELSTLKFTTVCILSLALGDYLPGTIVELLDSRRLVDIALPLKLAVAHKADDQQQRGGNDGSSNLR